MVFYPFSKMVHISFASFMELRKPLSSGGCLLPQIVWVFSRIPSYETILFHEYHNRSFARHFWCERTSLLNHIVHWCLQMVIVSSCFSSIIQGMTPWVLLLARGYKTIGWVAWTFAIHVYFPSQPLSIMDFRGFLRSSTFAIGVYL